MFRLTKKIMLGAAIAFAATTVGSGSVTADNDGLLKVVVPFKPGGSSDATARLVIARMAEHLGKKVVVDNRPGGGGTIAANAVYQAEPDGSTILLDGFHHVVNPLVLEDLKFDYNKFVPFSLLATFPLVISASPDFPAKNIQDLIDYAKKHPGKVTVGNGGHATGGHLIMEQFARSTGIDIVHVPYKGGRPVTRDTMAGVINAGIATVPSSGPLLDSNGEKGRPLAITADTRIPGRPNIPTLKEQGVTGVTITEWAALFGPPGTTQATLDEWHVALQKTLKEKPIQDKLTKLGAIIVGSSPSEFKVTMDELRVSVANLVVIAGIKK